MAIPYVRPYPVEKLDTPDCQTLVEILRSDEQWENPERRMLACHLSYEAAAHREAMLHLQLRISKCRNDDITRDLGQLEEIAQELAQHRKEMREMQEKENTILSALNATKARLSDAEFNKRVVQERTGSNLITELCRPELEAAGFAV